VLGTVYALTLRINGTSVACAVGIGAISCALLVANNLRDVPTDELVGKNTLAVRMGAAATRRFYLVLLVVPFVLVAAIAVRHPWAALALIAAPLALAPVRTVLRGAAGRDLIPVLGATGRLELVYAVLLGIGLALSH